MSGARNRPAVAAAPARATPRFVMLPEEEPGDVLPGGRFEVDVAACRPSPAARCVAEIHVEMLARSIREIGLLQPIVVRAVAGGFEVVAGLHRLYAFERLQRATIPAIVRHDDDLRAELALIDENLIRNELSPAERTLAIGRRKRIYEALHPETVLGAAGAGRPKVRKVCEAVEPAERFSQATARATGRSERIVQLEAQRMQEIGEASLARVVGTSLDKGEELDALAKLPEARRAELIARAAAGEAVTAKTAAKQALRAAREADLGARQLALPSRRYGVVLEDFEWDFEVWSRATGMDRHAANHYPVSVDAHTAAEIVARTKDRAALAADDCVWFAWATVPHLAIALDVMRQRGFEYKSSYAWGKDKAATGYWNRGRHEILLIGVRGAVPCPAPGTQWDSLILAPAGEHSQKPTIFHEIIEAYFPTLPKIELNARAARPGWDVWGYEAPAAAGAGAPAAAAAAGRGP